MRANLATGWTDGSLRAPRDRQAMATTVLGALFLAGAVLGSLSVVLPHPAVKHPVGLAAIGAASVVVAASLLLSRRLPTLVLNGVLALGTVLAGLTFLVAGVAAGIYGSLFVWIVLFAGYFLKPRHAFGHLGAVLAIYAFALLQVPSGAGYSGLTRWIFSAVSLTVVTSMTSWLVTTGRNAEQRTRRFFELSDDMLCTASADGYFDELNPAWTRVLGWSAEELRAHPFLEWVHPDDRERTVAESTKAFGDNSAAEFENRYFTKDGTWRWLAWSSTVSSETGLVYARATDVTRRRALEEEREALLRELDSLARTDALTGIPNRRWLDDELRREMSRATRMGFELCIAVVDLDHFKHVNDEHGHLEGDRILRTAATAWRAALRTTDFLARYGGEEFVVVLPDCGLEDARDVMARLCAATPVGLTSSVGIASWVPGEPATTLIGRADAALYEAKRGGRDKMVVAGPPAPSAAPPVVG